MRTYLPLNALRAFESAARHLSFTRAAAELCVTPTAISHQIRSLEEFLEAPLFERKNGRLILMPAAAAALDELSDGFDKLESALSPLCRRGGRQTVVVAISPSVASLWLLPKLHRFRDAAPGIDVSISTVIAPADYAETPCDVAISSVEDHPHRKVDYLMDEQILPVCSPALLPKGTGDPHAALAELPLIHDDKASERFPTWRRYFAEMQVVGRDPAAGLRFNQSSLAVAAAEQGHGILLGRSRLVAAAVASGRLTGFASHTYPVPCHYYTVCQSGVPSKPVRAFVEWLTAEVAGEDAGMRH